jgi:hypothetical protein
LIVAYKWYAIENPPDVQNTIPRLGRKSYDRNS